MAKESFWARGKLSMFAMGVDVSGGTMHGSGATKLPQGAPTSKMGEYPAAVAFGAMGPTAHKGTVLITWPMGAAEYLYRVDRDGDNTRVWVADGLTVEQFKALWSHVTGGDLPAKE